MPTPATVRLPRQLLGNVNHWEIGVLTSILRCGRDGCTIPVSTWAQLLGMGDRQLRRTLKGLLKRGLITMTGREGFTRRYQPVSSAEMVTAIQEAD